MRGLGCLKLRGTASYLDARGVTSNEETDILVLREIGMNEDIEDEWEIDDDDDEWSLQSQASLNTVVVDDTDVVVVVVDEKQAIFVVEMDKIVDVNSALMIDV